MIIQVAPSGYCNALGALVCVANETMLSAVSLTGDVCVPLPELELCWFPELL